MQNLKLFKLPYSSKHQKNNQLIMILDGTGSMIYEYYSIIDAYKKVFKKIIESNQVYAIQFGSLNGQVLIGNIDHQIGGSGNFSTAFENVLQQLHQNIIANIQANITICFVSDGHEPGNIEALQQQIDDVKKRYQIQFTSIAVGSGYPYELFQKFRYCFHNGVQSCTNVQVVERSEIQGTQDNCQINFINAFKMVKSQISQKRPIFLTQLVQETLTGEPKCFAFEGSVVASKQNTLTCQGLNIKQTKSAPYIAQFIQTSCQEFLKQQSIEKYKDSIEQAKQMKTVAESLISEIEESVSEQKDIVSELILQMKKDLAILNEIGSGKLNLKNLTDADKTKLLSYFNPNNDSIQQASLQHLNEQKQTQNFYEKLDELWMEKCDTPGQLAVLGLISGIIDEYIQEKKTSEEILQSLLNIQDKVLSVTIPYTINHKDWVKRFIDCKMKMRN